MEDLELNSMQESKRLFRIGTVSKLTGLTVHNIRVWEKRYGAIHPVRSSGGDRLYAARDIERLKLIKQLRKAGLPLSTLSAMPTQGLQNMLSETKPPVGTPPPEHSPTHAIPSQVLGYMEAISAMEFFKAERILGELMVQTEIGTMMQSFMAPLLREVGARWESGEINEAQEHAISAALRNRLGAYMTQHQPNGDSRPVLVGTPAGELHEFGALFCAAFMVKWGLNVLYLGPNLPAEAFVEAAGKTRAGTIVLSCISQLDLNRAQELHILRDSLPSDIAVLVGGAGIENVEGLPPGIRLVTSIPGLKDVLS